MVLLALNTLRQNPSDFTVHHVNAQFSNSLEEIGESSFGKILLTGKYLTQALRLRLSTPDPLLYYVPGPVKWSSVLRDWVILGLLRRFYPRVVFHWHAIGHGEWAHGSERLALEGPQWLDQLARKISAMVLHRPFASIVVSGTSQNDSVAVQSQWQRVICNGITDPCPDFADNLAPFRIARQQEIATAQLPCFKILFLSHGTEAKGTLDALACLIEVLDHCDPSWRFSTTFAGGISESIRSRFDSAVESLHSRWPERIQIREEGYLTGGDKHRCLVEHDIFLAPSHWESFGLTVIEAMAYGLPIVAAASDGVKGVLPANYPYLSPVANPSKLARNLRECCAGIIQQPAIRESFALRERFLALYQIKDFSDNLVRAFLDLGNGTTSHAVSTQARQAGPSKQGEGEGESPTKGFPPPIGNTDTSEVKSESITTAVGGRSESALQADDGPKLAHPDQDSSPIRGHSHSTAIGSPISPEIQDPKRKTHLTAYLADQNPGHDRSFGISRMSLVVLEALHDSGRVTIGTITSKTSQQAPDPVGLTRILPWGTRKKWIRFLTDHFHPLFLRLDSSPDVYYFPKGYLPLFSGFCRPSVVTIHDTIIQYDEDHYPQWRKRIEYAYWAMMLKHTLRNADRILTVSVSSKRQIQEFMERHGIPRKEITVTYEPCLYERIPQPVAPAKENYVIHLASCEPHKRTAHLIRWWHDAESLGRNLPMLHLIGTVPPEVQSLLASSHGIVKSPFLEEAALQSAYRSARALILPSEIEGFGLPALEAYYLGTPVCFVKGTSVEEILGVATDQGGFSLERADSLWSALEEVMAMSAEKVRGCGIILRETYSAETMAEKMVAVFDEVVSCEC